MQRQWPGFNEKANVVIPLAPDTFPLANKDIEVFGETFTPKDELHITVIGSDLGLLLQQRIQQDQSINKLLKKIFSETDWSFKQTGPVHMLSRSKQGVVQQSIILLVDMPGLAAFYKQLITSGLLAPDTPLPPAHITLYTRFCPSGIGVPSEDVLAALSVKTLSVSRLKEMAEDSAE